MERVPSYEAVHQRLVRKFGAARTHPCTFCEERARDWALVREPKWFDPQGPYTDDPEAYAPLCGSCHKRYDQNLPPCPHGPARDRTPVGTCRECRNTRERAYLKKRYAEDAEWRAAKRAYFNEWRATHPEMNERGSAKKRARYAEDPTYREDKLAKNKAYYEENSERAIAREREKFAANPELRETKNARARELHRERMATDPVYREKKQAASRASKARRKAQKDDLGNPS